ncbi:MAG: hypothetical protein MUP66_03685 [Candidatus Nanohaloarchaeota archaeon QJJ-5]|nr:hypothetical protein [Candidatus Nanohaloarchaeota archaeon QJJ-5]
MRWVIIGVIITLFLVPTVTAQTNSTDTVAGPDFLSGIGPHEPHVDNPWAAVVTAIVVTGVILRGLRVYGDD